MKKLVKILIKILLIFIFFFLLVGLIENVFDMEVENYMIYMLFALIAGTLGWYSKSNEK